MLPPEQFILQAIKKKGVKTGRGRGGKGLHVVYSKLNKALRQKYRIDPIALINDMCDRKLIEKRWRRGGPLLYLYGEAPVEDTVEQFYNDVTGDEEPEPQTDPLGLGPPPVEDQSY